MADAAGARGVVRNAAWITAAALGGAGLALQARVNADLAGHVGDALFAAAVSFAVGLVLLGIVALVRPVHRRGIGRAVTAFRDGTAPWWVSGMGLIGAAVVATQSFAAGPLGVALYTVAFVAGQIASGLVVDRIGMLGAPKRAITPARLAGAVLGLTGVVVGFVGSGESVRAPGLVLLALGVGMLLPLQQQMMGFVARVAHSPIASAFVNFAVGLVALSALALALGAWQRFGMLPANPWLYVGGALGAAFVALSSAVVQRIGVLMMGLALIAGQLIGALVIDLVTPDAGAVSIWTVVAVLVTIGSMAVTAVPALVRRRAA